MSITILVEQLILLFIIIMLGYLMNKVNIIDTNFNQKGSKLIINLTMPCMIINSVLTLSDRPDSKDVITVFIVAIAIYTILPVIAYGLTKITKTLPSQQGVYMFMFVFSNVGFMGFPILDAIYGSVAVFYGGIINIIFNICCFSYGILMMNHGRNSGNRLELKKLLSPGIISSLLSIVIYIFNIHIFGIIQRTIATVGNLTSTLAMIIIGSTLATINLKNVFNDLRVYIFALIKQLIIPILLIPLCRLLITDNLIYGVTILMLLMPVANTAVLFSNDYGHNQQLTAKTVFITTAMSLFTIPLGIIISQ